MVCVGFCSIFRRFVTLCSALWFCWCDLPCSWYVVIENSRVSAYLNAFSPVAPVTVEIVGPKKYPAAAGIRTIPLILTVFGPLAAANLKAEDRNDPFLYCKMVAGVGTVSACLLTLYLKLRMERKHNTTND